MQNNAIQTTSSGFPFGMIMSERSFSSEKYRYGFNSQEKDDEVAGSGNINTAEYWEYDSRLGRRWNVDPIVKPWESSYSTFLNIPLYFTDPLGLDPPERYGKGTQLLNWLKGDKYKNKANKYAVANKIDEAKIEISKGKIKIDESHYSFEITESEEGTFSVQAVYNEKTTIFQETKEEGIVTNQSEINFKISTTATIFGTIPGTFRLGTKLHPFNPMYHGNGWPGNQYTKTYKFSKAANLAGLVFLGIGTAFDIYGVRQYYKKGPNDRDAVHPGKAGLNLGMGVYGMCINPVTGIVYGGIDVFYPGGWPGYCNDVEGIQKETDRISDAGPNKIRLIPFGPK